MPTFVLSVNDEYFEMLASEAKSRGVKVQMLLRAVVIPEWSRMSLAARTERVKTSVTGPRNDRDTMVKEPQEALPRITIANRPRRDVDNYRSMYFRSIRRPSGQ